MFFKDAMEVKGKHATVMRDGVYYYLPVEIGVKDRDPNIPIPCIRPYTEVIKAAEKFAEYGKLPITVRHPDKFLNLHDSASYSNGEAEKPLLNTNSNYTVIDCIFNLKGQALKDYDSGTRQLSCGWEGDFEKSEPGSPYEFIQRFKDINHIAIVPTGRAGEICKINDGGLKMKLEKVKALFAAKKIELTDEDNKILDELQLDTAIDDKKKKAKDEENEDGDEEEEKEEKKEKMKDKKKKNKDEAVDVKDAIEIAQKAIVTQFADVQPIMGEFKTNETAGKMPNQIKAMFIKKVANTDIKDSDPTLDAVFTMVKMNYQNPAWKGKNTNVTDSEAVDLAGSISSISFAEVK
jgi:hypothetical protein